ncbi:MAG: biotin/lipoate A/B protein ligase family protein [Acidimicrobiia bacterium]
MRTIELLRQGTPDRPEMDTAISAIILRQVGSGSRPETLRIHQPGKNVAFGRREIHLSGYQEAVDIARGLGFEATERLAGGRAAIFHPGTIAISWAIPSDEPRRGIEDRFEEISRYVSSALKNIGVNAQIGEVPGEYCPGQHSISVGGRHKIFGVGQRISSGASHMGGVLVVDGADLIRSVLEPVYEALDFTWRPETTGDIRGAGVTTDYGEIVASLIAAFEQTYRIEESALDSDTMAHASRAAERYLSPKSSSHRATASEPGSISDI